ncbi:MAG TPA: arsenite efflux transporter metallochaperone ArsD [Polyangiaceae bacterium]
MSTIRVFDPAMCCSTGICGPAVDPQLARFAADLGWLKSQGVSVERFNLSQQPAAFAEDAAVTAALAASGEASLPLVQVGGEVKSSGMYPSRDALAAWAGIAVPPCNPAGAEGNPESSCARGQDGLSVSSSNGCFAPTDGRAAQKKSGCC